MRARALGLTVSVRQIFHSHGSLVASYAPKPCDNTDVGPREFGEAVVFWHH